MVRTKYFVIEILMEEERAKGSRTPQQMEEYRAELERSVGYGDLGRIALGKGCAYLIDFAVWFTQFLTIVAYFIFLANTIYTLFPLRPAAVPINTTAIPAGDDIDGEIVGNVCPISSPNGIFYELRTNIGVPMLNIPSLNYAPPKCQSSKGYNPEPVRHKRAVEHVAFANKEAGLKYLDVNVSPKLEIKFKNKNNNGVQVGQSNTTTTTATTTTTTMATKSTSTAATIKPTTTVATNTTTPVSTPPPTPHLFLKSIAPDMKLLFFIPLPFFLSTSLVRELRFLSPLTVVATFALFIGAFSVLGFEISGTFIYFLY